MQSPDSSTEHKRIYISRVRLFLQYRSLFRNNTRLSLGKTTESNNISRVLSFHYGFPFAAGAAISIRNARGSIANVRFDFLPVTGKNAFLINNMRIVYDVIMFYFCYSGG